MDSVSLDSDSKDEDSNSDSDAPKTPLHSPQPMQETPSTSPCIQCNDWKLEEEVTELAAEQAAAGAPAHQHPFGTIETHSYSDDKYLLEL
eukprot:2029005-Rhodomonas_salina.3